MKDHYILQIDTATPVCSVAISLNGKTLYLKEESGQNIHAEHLTLFIEEILDEAKISLAALSAIAISKGPGSYTGLRIGVSTAKGLCYGVDLPLIALDSLEALAVGFRRQRADLGSEALLCPMIDARRMEVYQAIFSSDGLAFQQTRAQIVEKNTYNDIFEQENSVEQIFLFGSGADKFEELFCHDEHVQVVKGFQSSAAYLDSLAYQAFLKSKFEDLAYFEPYYLKDFVPTTPKKKIEK